jgi:hypothetical protein
MASDKYPRILGERGAVRLVQIGHDAYCLECALHEDAMGIRSDWYPVPLDDSARFVAVWLAEVLRDSLDINNSALN